jgi:hypothetical protein
VNAGKVEAILWDDGDYVSALDDIWYVSGDGVDAHFGESGGFSAPDPRDA